jgi:hypothetical protein
VALTIGLLSSTASAAPEGALTLSPTTGNNATTEFTLTPPSGAHCTGPGTASYRWSAYIIDASIDATTLTFIGSGPSTVAGKYTSALLSSPDGTPWTLKNPSATPVGLISSIPPFSLAPNVNGQDLVAGDYKLGFACTLSGAVEGGHYWETVITLSSVTSTGFNWAQSTAPTTTTTLAATTTTAAGTNTTTVSGATTTTRPASTTTVGGTTTTVAGATTTTSGGATTTVAGTTTTTRAITTTIVGSGGSGQIATTGGAPLPIIVWAIVLLVLGRMAILLVRPSRGSSRR